MNFEEFRRSLLDPISFLEEEGPSAIVVESGWELLGREFLSISGRSMETYLLPRLILPRRENSSLSFRRGGKEVTYKRIKNFWQKVTPGEQPLVCVIEKSDLEVWDRHQVGKVLDVKAGAWQRWVNQKMCHPARILNHHRWCD